MLRCYAVLHSNILKAVQISWKSKGSIQKQPKDAYRNSGIKTYLKVLIIPIAWGNKPPKPPGTASMFSAKRVGVCLANLGAGLLHSFRELYTVCYTLLFFQAKNNFKLKLYNSVTNSDSNVLKTPVALRSLQPCRIHQEAEHQNCQLLILRIMVCAQI